LLHSKTEYFQRLLALLDIFVGILVYLAVLNVYLVLKPHEYDIYSNHLGLLVFIVLTIGATRRFTNQDLRIHSNAILSQIWNVGTMMVLAFVIIVSTLFLFDVDFVSRYVFVGFFIANTVALIFVRAFLVWWYFSKHREKQENFLRVLIVGSGKRAHHLAAELKKNSEWGIRIVGFLDPDDPRKYNRRQTDRVLGHVDQISEVLSANVVEEVVIAVPRGMLKDLKSIFDACQEEGVTLRYMADIYDFKAARIRLNMVGKIPLLTFEPVARDEAMLVTKRLTDISITLISMIFILPLFLVIAIVIRLDSPGPAFFMQERAGLHKRKFRLFKFRTMVVDAEERMAEVEHLNEADGPNFKIANDPRTTRIGGFLRRSSIDELPQLFNVLKGDMSLVGPRPMSLRDVSLFDKGIQRKRFSVRPGITCLWQVSGRSDLSFDDWLRLDLEYIDSWTLGLDFRILLKTIPAVLGGSGAV